MEKITEEMRLKLRKPLDEKAISKHPTKTYLSSIKAIYVTERLNDVFGVGSWRTKVEKVSENDKGMVVVKLIFEIPEFGVYFESYGGNDNGGIGNKNFDLGDAYKGATTDAITKVGSFLEIGIDVFKGLSDFKNEPKQDIVWLTKEQFDLAIKSDIKGIDATLKAFSTGNKKLKKEYKEALENQLILLNNISSDEQFNKI